MAWARLSIRARVSTQGPSPRLPFRVSDYYGRDGYISRTDLAGLNLTTMPKVLIETGNMRNAADAALLVSPKVQRAVATALAAAIARFLAGH